MQARRINLGLAGICTALLILSASCGGGGSSAGPEQIHLPGGDSGEKVYSPPVIVPPAESFVDRAPTGADPGTSWVSSCYEPVEAKLPGSVYQNASLAGWADIIFQGVNAARVAEGLDALRRDPNLDLTAQSHARDMALRNYFGHVSPEGLEPWDRMQALKMTGILYAAENAAKGQESASEIVSGWLNSEKHRANIMKPNLTSIGLGVYYDPTDAQMPIHAIADFSDYKPAAQ